MATSRSRCAPLYLNSLSRSGWSRWATSASASSASKLSTNLPVWQVTQAFFMTPGSGAVAGVALFRQAARQGLRLLSQQKTQLQTRHLGTVRAVSMLPEAHETVAVDEEHVGGVLRRVLAEDGAGGIDHHRVVDAIVLEEPPHPAARVARRHADRRYAARAELLQHRHQERQVLLAVRAVLVEEAQHHHASLQGREAHGPALEVPGGEDGGAWVLRVPQIEPATLLGEHAGQVAQGRLGGGDAGLELPAQVGLHAEPHDTVAVEQDHGGGIADLEGLRDRARVAQDRQRDVVDPDELVDPVDRVAAETEEDGRVVGAVVAEATELARQIGRERRPGPEEQQ